MNKTFGRYLTITFKDLVSSIMVNEDKTEVRTGEVYDLFLDTTYKMKQQGIDGRVEYSRDYLKEFRECESQFEVGIGYIKLSDGYNIEWLHENVVSHMSREKLGILGLIEQENDYTL